MEYTPITRKEKYGQGWMGEENYKETVIQRYREQRKRKSEVVIANIEDIKRIDKEYREKMYTDELLHDNWTHEDLRVLFGDTAGRCHYEDENWSLESSDESNAWSSIRGDTIFTGFSKRYYTLFGGRLLPCHEVKAKNGIVWFRDEARLIENTVKCGYASKPDGQGWAMPTRGNCMVCGGSGPVRETCQNGCRRATNEETKKKDRFWSFLREPSDKWTTDNGWSCYEFIKMPNDGGIIDAEFFAEANYDDSDIAATIMSYMRIKPRASGRVSPRLTMNVIYPDWLEDFWAESTRRLEEDHPSWKRVVKLCEEKGYGHPYKLNKGVKHVPYWDEDPFNEVGKVEDHAAGVCWSEAHERKKQKLFGSFHSKREAQFLVGLGEVPEDENKAVEEQKQARCV